MDWTAEDLNWVLVCVCVCPNYTFLRAADKGVQRGQSQQIGVGFLRSYGSRGVSHVGPDGSLQRPGELGAPGGPSHSGPG